MVMTERSHRAGRDDDVAGGLTDALEHAEQQRERDPRTGKAAAAQRIQHQASWVDLQIRRAQERGDFDDLAGAGRPIEDLGRRDDPDWWVKRLIEREQITGVLPPGLQLRKDDAELDDRLDALSAEPEVRRELAEFNERIRQALLTNLGGPPVITTRRDVEAEVAAWRARAVRRRREQAAARDAVPGPTRRSRWPWGRRSPR